MKEQLKFSFELALSCSPNILCNTRKRAERWLAQGEPDWSPGRNTTPDLPLSLVIPPPLSTSQAWEGSLDTTIWRWCQSLSDDKKFIFNQNKASKETYYEMGLWHFLHKDGLWRITSERKAPSSEAGITDSLCSWWCRTKMWPHALKLAFHWTPERQLICPPPRKNWRQISVSFLPKKKTPTYHNSPLNSSLYTEEAKDFLISSKKMPAMCSHRVPVPWRRRAPGLSQEPPSWSTFNSLLCKTPDTVWPFRSKLQSQDSPACVPPRSIRWPHQLTQISR